MLKRLITGTAAAALAGTMLLGSDAWTGLGVTLAICALASTLAIRAALRVDPAEAIG